MSAAFEALKYSLRQSKDGVVVAFVVQPHDVTPELMALPVGARVMIGWSQIGDDEKPVASGVKRENSGPAPTIPPEPPQAKDEGAQLVQQCAIACADARFQRYLRGCGYDVSSAADAATVIRARLAIESRSEIATNKTAQATWKLFYSTYERWLTDLNYGAVRR